MPKNTFFEGTKKNFCAKKFLGLFVHVQRWLVQKKTTLDQTDEHTYVGRSKILGEDPKVQKVLRQVRKCRFYTVLKPNLGSG